MDTLSILVSCLSDYIEESTLNSYGAGVPKSYFVNHQDAWFGGVDNAMKTLGTAQVVPSGDIIRLQNKAIRDCWVVTGNHLRRAMFVLSANTNIYPEELKEDSACRKMLTHMKVRT